MDTFNYWRQQTPEKPLFPDAEWNRPERRDQAGKLGIIGGNKLGFAGVAEAYGVAEQAGVGAVRVLLPDALRSSVPPTMTDVLFSPSNPSGGLSKEALGEMIALGSWADGVLLVGDAGRNSETTIAYEEFVKQYSKPLIITRDAIDILKNTPQVLADRPQTLIVASFAQMQKLFQGLYYPKVLTFSLQLANVVEIVHKFTLSYPCTLMVLHKDHLIVAHGGQVITQDWDNAMAIWRGSVAARAASYWLWNPSTVLESVVASIDN